MSTNLRDLDEERIANALADVGVEVTLGETFTPKIESFVEAIHKLGAQRDEAKAQAKAAHIISSRELKRAKWLHECAEKDYEKYRSLYLQLKESIKEE